MVACPDLDLIRRSHESFDFSARRRAHGTRQSRRPNSQMPKGPRRCVGRMSATRSGRPRRVREFDWLRHRSIAADLLVVECRHQLLGDDLWMVEHLLDRSYRCHGTRSPKISSHSSAVRAARRLALRAIRPHVRRDCASSRSADRSPVPGARSAHIMQRRNDWSAARHKGAPPCRMDAGQPPVPELRATSRPSLSAHTKRPA